MAAAMRFTTDSAASERRPTEPVSHHAAVFMTIVTIAAAIESQAKRVRLGCVEVIAGTSRAIRGGGQARRPGRSAPEGEPTMVRSPPDAAGRAADPRSRRAGAGGRGLP